MSDKIFDSTIGALNTSLNLRSMNQNVISSNIANADTPGFKAKSVDFEQTFREVLGTNDQLPIQSAEDGHIAPQAYDPVFPEIYEETNGVESLDGNTVDRAAEMAKMSENQIMYDSSVEMLKKKLGMLKYTVAEGGGNR